MLAQNFKSAVDLEITEIELGALIKVLGLLERGELFHVENYLNRELRGKEIFNMEEVARRDCGTVACLCGWAFILSDGKAFPEVQHYLDGQAMPTRRFSLALHDLFGFRVSMQTLRTISPEQAATALRNFLTTGKAAWVLP